MNTRFGGAHTTECLTAPAGYAGSCLGKGQHGWSLGGVAMSMREKCVASPLYLATEILSAAWQRNLFKTPSEAHVLVEQAIIGQQNLLYVDHRGTGKTTLVDEVGGVWQLIKYVNDSLAVFHGSMPNAKGISEQIRDQFAANERLWLVYPDYKMATSAEQGNVLSWSVPGRYLITREGSVEIATPETATAGRHWDVILASDLMNTQTTPPPCGLATIEKMKAIIAWYSQSDGLLKSKAVNPRAHKRIDSNRWADGDLAGELIRKDTEDTFVKVIRGVKRAADGSFIPTWPQVFPSEELAKIHASPSMTAATWAANFCSDPLPEGGMAFREEWLHIYGADTKCQCGASHPEPKKIEMAVTVDPAFSDSKVEKKRTDRSAMIAAGQIAGTGQLYVDATRAGRWSPNEFLDQLFALIDTRKPEWVGIEDTGSSRALIAMFWNEMTRSKRYVRYREIKPGGRSKMSRIAALHQAAQKYGLYLRPGMDELREELLRFGVAEHDDLADALAYRAMEMYNLPEAPAEAEAPRPTEVPPTHRTDGTDILNALERRQSAREAAGKRWMRRTA